MSDPSRTNQELLQEICTLKKRIWELEKSETDLKAADEALKDVQTRYRLLFEHAPYGIVIVDPASARFMEFNETACRQLGYSREEFSGLSIPDVEVIESPEETQKRIENVIREGRDDFETMHCTKQGEIRNIQVTAQMTEISGYAVYHCVWRDITEHKRAEEEIIKERSKLKTLSDNAPFGMALIDKDGHFTYISPKFTELFGFDLSHIPDGRTWFRKAFPNAEYRHMVIAGWVGELEGAKPGTRKPRVYTVTCRDGTQKIVSFITSVLVSGDYLTACEDVTELRRLESQLRQAQKMEAVGTLAGGIAHDFNNVLTVITGYSALLKMEMAKNDPLQSYVENIRSSAEKAAYLTRGLLSFSRQQPMVLAPVNINETLRSVEKLLKRLLTENIVIKTLLSPEEITIMADASQVDQILFNLATNARDSMPRGGAFIIETKQVELDDEFVRLHGYGKPGRFALLSVSDTGLGMDEATRERIFDPFFTTKAEGKGTGLGLSSVYGSVKQHSGFITVYSEPNMGTTFHIYLPAVNKISKEEKPAPVAVEGGRETILVAEDNDAVRDLMKRILTEYGYTVILARDGVEAVEEFKKTEKVDLLIFDSVMPGKNGREAYNEIHDIRPDIKIIFTSGYMRDVFLDKDIEDKKFEFMSKPISPSALLRKVREVLDETASQ